MCSWAGVSCCPVQVSTWVVSWLDSVGLMCARCTISGLPSFPGPLGARRLLAVALQHWHLNVTMHQQCKILLVIKRLLPTILDMLQPLLDAEEAAIRVPWWCRGLGSGVVCAMAWVTAVEQVRSLAWELSHAADRAERKIPISVNSWQRDRLTKLICSNPCYSLNYSCVSVGRSPFILMVFPLNFVPAQWLIYCAIWI